MAATAARTALRAMIDTGELVVAPGVFDGLSACIAARVGSHAAYLTGAGVAASGFGLPDIGLITSTEMVERTRVIVRASGDLPVIADADTGYGTTLNVVRTVQEYEAAGVAAIQIEDQAFPKRCGHLPDKELVSAEEFIDKIAAAREARTDADLLIVARTDARGPLGLNEAIRRANLYAGAGADVVFIEAPESVEEIEQIAAEVSAPKLINLVLGGLTPAESGDRLRELGYAIAIHPSAGLAHAALGMLNAFCELAGTSPARFMPTKPAEFFNLVGMAEWFALGERLTPASTRGGEAR
jgi:2-methylisocitrate lyase-like PEP mutase family enzyme